MLRKPLLFLDVGKGGKGVYPGFLGMKRLRVFLLPPGWDASPSEGYLPALNSPVLIYTPVWREAL